MPLWLGVLLIIASKGGNLNKVYTLLNENITNGDLLIYCNAIVAPIFYLALAEIRGKETFPTKMFHILFFVLIMIFSATTYALRLAKFDFNESFISYASYCTLFVSLCILYTSAVLNRGRKDLPNQIMSRQTKSYVEQYGARREAKND